MANPRTSWGGEETEMAGGRPGSGTADTWDSDTHLGAGTHTCIRGAELGLQAGGGG